ncbi:MAG TPA: L,D-transpeptidase family protein [Ilumatobacteraceae bacterium]|nr:L,D-transpeptidase family protein [Ilumatobacteraceae bacterium]
MIRPAAPRHHRRLGLLAPLAGLLVACSTTVSSAPPDTTEPTTTVEDTTTTESTTTTVAESTTTAVIVPTTLALTVESAPVGAGIVPVGKHSGPDTAVVQRRLTELGFWVGDADGKYGFATTQAVMAFQKYAGLSASGKVDDATAFWLQAYQEKAHGTAPYGTMVEVDKKRQLLFIIVDGRTVWTFNTSTGSGKPYTAVNHNDPSQIESGDAVTPNGLWKVERERPDGWWEGDLGRIYRPKYFRGGVAIHGMTKVPNYPASHGCVRVSVPAMDFIWASGLVPVGTPVWVHE